MTKTPALRVIPGTAAEPGPALPHDIGAEQAVLGAVMLAPATLAEVTAILDDSGAFYRPAHQIIWEAITALAARGAPYDPLSVGAELGRDTERVGGATYLHTLIAAVPTAANAAWYARIVADLAYARRVAETGTRLTQIATEAAGDSTADLRGQVTAQVAALTEPAGRGWPDPVPLTATRDLPAFPLWAFPPWLGEYCAALAEATQTPPDLAGSLALAVLAVTAAQKIWIATPTWREPACLYTVVVMPPGSRKSEVFAAMTAPLRDAETILTDQARPVIAEAVIRRRIAEATAERTAKAAENPGTDKPDTVTTALMEAAEARIELDNATVPAPPCLFTDDATVERLASRLAEQGGRFAILSPEGEIFSIAAGRYSGTPSFGVLKAGHAGEALRIDRQGRPPDHIEHATLTLGICTQPGVLARLGDTPQFRDQGLLGRLLYAVPDSLMGWRNERPDPMPAQLREAYTASITTLALTLTGLADPGQLTFTPAAAEAITAMLADTEPRFRPGTGDLAHMTDWGGKLVGATVRIAGLLHLAAHFRDGWAQPIQPATFEAARQIADYYTTHAQHAYEVIGADPATVHARAILDWLRTTGTSRFTARDLMRGRKDRFAKVADTEAPLRVLETSGWIRRLPAPPRHGRGQPPATAWEAHPEATR